MATVIGGGKATTRDAQDAIEVRMMTRMTVMMMTSSSRESPADCTSSLLPSCLTKRRPSSTASRVAACESLRDALLATDAEGFKLHRIGCC